MRTCARIFLSAVAGAFLLGAAPCLADRDESNSIHKGATSFQFLTFTSYSNFMTNGIFVNTHFSDRGSLRLGTSFGLNDFTGSSSPAGEYIDTELRRSHNLQVAAELNEYVDSRGPVTAFLAIGPYWSRNRVLYQSTHQYLPSDSTMPSSSYQRYERTSWVVGASGAVGFEWFFKRKLSLLARVGATIGFGKSHEKSDSYSGPPPPGYQQRQFNFNVAGASTSSAALGLAVYL